MLHRLVMNRLALETAYERLGQAAADVRGVPERPSVAGGIAVRSMPVEVSRAGVFLSEERGARVWQLVVGLQAASEALEASTRAGAHLVQELIDGTYALDRDLAAASS